MAKSFQEFASGLAAPLSLLGAKPSSLPIIARRVRTDLALAVEHGVFPAGTRFSVRMPSHGSLTVGIVEWRGAVFTREYTEYIMDPTVADPTVAYGTPGCPRLEANSRLDPELRASLRNVESIANRHNFNHSDTRSDYFNYGYSLTVQADVVEAISHASLRTESDPQLAALREQAADAARALGDKVVRSICGRAGLAGASEWAIERLMRVARRAGGKPVAYDKRRNGWFPVASQVAP